MRIGVLSDFVSPSYGSGLALQSLLLARLLREAGHEVLVIGPEPAATEERVDANALTFPAVSHPTFTGIRLAFPWPMSRLADLPPLDVIHAQLTSHFLHLGYLWRRVHGTALVNTCTLHLPSYAHNFIPEKLQQNGRTRMRGLALARRLEHAFAALTNRCDGLVVQSPSQVGYWRERGVHIPTTYVPRPIDPSRFDRPLGPDPFSAGCPPGSRLFTCSRIDREKNLRRLLRIFDRHVAPHLATATLTVAGTGPELGRLRQAAAALDHADRVFLPGRIDPWAIADWYRRADLFVHTSTSETFGNVINEAMWSGLAVVAFEDGMGVSGQITDGVTGVLVDPDDPDADARFGRHVRYLLADPEAAWQYGLTARCTARRRSSAHTVVSRLEAVYRGAMDRVRRSEPVVTPGACFRARMRHGLAWTAGVGSFLVASQAGHALGLVRGPEG